MSENTELITKKIKQAQINTLRVMRMESKISSYEYLLLLDTLGLLNEASLLSQQENEDESDI